SSVRGTTRVESNLSAAENMSFGGNLIHALASHSWAFVLLTRIPHIRTQASAITSACCIKAALPLYDICYVVRRRGHTDRSHTVSSARVTAAALHSPPSISGCAYPRRLP